ncbi:hsp90-like protein [Phlyctema vagabunda]|uniref:Hsp90-like protein n=1 Tax=Phlyctema vagabunda TaxID=108571 RepID=A0ABR4PL28_9HELO
MRRAEISAQIAAADREELITRVEEMEDRFKHMAEHAPVGMFNYAPSGVLLWANATWYEITGHPVNTGASLSFADLISDLEEKSKFDERWAMLMEDQALVRYEIRLKKPWTKQIPGTDEMFEGATWVLASAYPEKNEDGSIRSIMGTITDISEQKWAEGVQDTRRKEAEELKRQQENFIDMVSHEMRNPLSAIIQSSDGIIGTLSSSRLLQNRDDLADIEDSIETIILCAQHQKRIIDDILTLSKLDSDLLSIIPISIQPLTVVQRALKMFSSECQANGIEAALTVKNSFYKMNVDWVMLDPGRLLQVLVNLITNAIKITIPETEKRINLSIGASASRPTQKEHQIDYLPTKLSRQDSDLEAPEGNEFFLKFAVSDTGAGLTESESQKLFKRFSQALPRTHVQYSGSGLGLFISRELTEMQGGEIGFKSEPGKGSTFAFYIKARPVTPPRPSFQRSSSPSKLSQAEKDMAFMSRIAAGDVLSHAGLPTAGDSVAKNPAAKQVVLIVEDNLVNQKVLSKQLVNENYIVHVANHGEEALSFLQNTRYWTNGGSEEDVYMILMDLEMPVMDGLTCIQKIRGLQRDGTMQGHVPVIAVTANARRQQIDTAIAAGMDDVMCKPFRVNELITKMKSVKERVQDIEDD